MIPVVRNDWDVWKGPGKQRPSKNSRQVILLTFFLTKYSFTKNRLEILTCKSLKFLICQQVLVYIWNLEFRHFMPKRVENSVLLLLCCYRL